jgi:hypothetical protein
MVPVVAECAAPEELNTWVVGLWYTQQELSERLQGAAQDGDMRLLRSALQDGAAVDLPAGGPSGLTALHWAMVSGHTSCGKLLLERGASLRPGDGWTSPGR